MIANPGTAMSSPGTTAHCLAEARHVKFAELQNPHLSDGRIEFRSVTSSDLRGCGIELHLSIHRPGNFFSLSNSTAGRSSSLCELSPFDLHLKKWITLRKRTRNVTLSQHTSMTVRVIAAMFGKFSVSRIINQQKNLEAVPPKRKSKCGYKRETIPRKDKFLVRYSIMYPYKKVDIFKENY
ncbi:hypothetical protein TNCV_485051 [Trichonephila clavipes]|nr:hypothetical protein TNCV_485051 [Trichonephila clavipes]